MKVEIKKIENSFASSYRLAIVPEDDNDETLITLLTDQPNSSFSYHDGTALVSIGGAGSRLDSAIRESSEALKNKLSKELRKQNKSLATFQKIGRTPLQKKAKKKAKPSGVSKFWKRMTKAQRKAEMQRRFLKGIENKKNKETVAIQERNGGKEESQHE